ncbi:MAG: glycosyltransferase family 39 protein [Planctomycetes bacterium]|nr:glycosyltransferase family 39 protein [Planctomycetota bacterium]
MKRPDPSRRAVLLCALVPLAVFLVLGCALLADFGPTWDCANGEYPHGEQYLAFLLSGDGAYLDFPPPLKPARFREPHLDYASIDWLTWPQAYPFAALLSALSCRVLWSGLGLVPSLQAHNLVVVLCAGLLLFLAAAWSAARFGRVAAGGAAAALMLCPRFFADSFNNLKDVPEALLYAAALLAAYAGLRGGKLRFWAATGVLTGLALAQKPNALFLPVHGFLLYACCNAERLLARRGLLPFPWKGLLLAAPLFVLAYLAVSPMLWTDTAARLLDQFGFILLVGTEAGADALDGVRHLFWTTPPAILLLAAIGLCSKRAHGDERWLLVLGVAVPVGRTALPGMSNFDGVRHFIEFMPFLAILAGLGLAAVVSATLASAPLRARGRAARLAATLVLAGAFFAFPAAQVVATHPYGICYFNAFAGGLSGAQARGLPEATDYWCHSYWLGLARIADHGVEGARVIVPVAEHVARAAAPLRLRRGIELCDPYEPGAPPALYVMYATRQGWYDPLARSLEQESVPWHEVLVQGAPILKIHEIREPERIAAAARLWAEHRAYARVGLWLFDHARGAEGILKNAPRLGREETLRRLSPLLGPEVRRDLDLAVGYAVRQP